jgi:diguanylate cyclase (GGDEF)-like protein/PAS domain S-box-containing protein
MDGGRGSKQSRGSGARLIGLAAAYFAVAAITIGFTRYHGGVAHVWAATAVLLAHLANRPTADWAKAALVCGLVGAVATSMFGLGPKGAIPFAAINIAEAVGGAALLRRLVPSGMRFGSLREIAVFIGVAAIVMPVSCGLPAGIVAHWITGSSILGNWLDFFTGHALGAITFTPLFMLISSGKVRTWATVADRRDCIEAPICFAAVIAATFAAFAQSSVPLLFLPSLPIVVTVFRVGRLGAVTAAALLSVIAIGCTVAGYGPINAIDASQGVRAQILQMYLACMVLTALPAAAELKHRKSTFAELQKTSTVARLVLDRSGDIIMHLQLDGTIQFVSASVRTIAGYEPEDLVGRKPHDLIHADDIEEVIRVHRQALANPDDTLIVEYRARRADHEWTWYEVHTRATVDENGASTGVINISHDITSRKRAENQLVADAQTDPLTRLLNRRALDTALEERSAGGARFSIALFDLDHFKAVNDTYGHDTGDLVLKVFADHLQRAFRKGDVIARLGGEEFIAILDDANAAEAQEICERLREKFARKSLSATDGRTFSVTVSGGISTWREGSDLWQLVAEADAALYQAKNLGRNRLALAA